MFRLSWKHAALPIVAALLLSGLAGWALLPRTGEHNAAFSTAVHPAATDSIRATSQYGTPRTDFSVSLSQGRVYFTAYDPADARAQVTITDQNASRDGVGTPAANWSVDFSTGFYNYSWQWGAYYQLPLTLTHEGMWNITISGATAGVYSTSFFVHTYYVSLASDAPVYLPGHTATITYFVRATANSGPFSTFTSLRALVTYTNSGGTPVNLSTTPSALAVASTGSFTLVVPTNIATFGSVYIQLWANQTSSVGNGSEEGFYAVTVGNLWPLSITLGTCSSGCYTNFLTASALAFLRVSVSINDGSGGAYPAAGLTVRLTFQSGSTNLTSSAVPGNPPVSQVTNSSGGVGAIFIASPTVFSTTQLNSVVVNVTDPLFTKTARLGSTHFTVAPVAQGVARLGLTLNQVQYYSGDTVTGSWTLGGTNSTAVQGWQSDGWYVYNANTGGLLATGAITSTGTSGSFTWMTPTSFVGTLEIYVTAHNASQSLDAFTEANVISPLILLSPSETYYQAGDTVQVGIATAGSVFSGATLFGSAVDPTGATLWSGVLSGNSFSLAIPQVAPPSSLRVSVAAQSASAGLIGTATTTLYLASGYSLVAGVDTPSNYADGTYQPGQTVTIHYTLSAIGTSALSKAYRLVVYPTLFGSGLGTRSFDTTSSSGTVSYTIPDGLPTGSVLFEVSMTVIGCAIYPCGATTLFSLNIEPSPSALAYEVPAGSGITVGWLVLLGLIVVVALFTWRAVRGRRRPVMMTPVTSSSTGSSSGGSGSGSANWKEEPSSSRGSDTPPGSPPLPTPPSGKP